MKKTYIIPAVKLVNLDATEMLAGSPGVSNGSSLGETPEDDHNDNQFVKQQSQWDKEW